MEYNNIPVCYFHFGGRWWTLAHYDLSGHLWYIIACLVGKSDFFVIDPGRVWKAYQSAPIHVWKVISSRLPQLFVSVALPCEDGLVHPPSQEKATRSRPQTEREGTCEGIIGSSQDAWTRTDAGRTADDVGSERLGLLCSKAASAFQQQKHLLLLSHQHL